MTEIKSINILKDIICGRELKIQMILEKWKVSQKDIEVIMDEISFIESDTIKLFKERLIDEQYSNKYQLMKEHESQSEGTKQHKPYKKRIYKVYKNGKFVAEGNARYLKERFDFDKSALSRIKEKGKMKGYDIIAEEIEDDTNNEI